MSNLLFQKDTANCTAPLNLSLQMPPCCRYQGPKKPPMFENNYNEPKVAKLAVSMVRWRCPNHIGNKTINLDCYGTLNIPQYDRIM